jgi:hypothetical protein
MSNENDYNLQAVIDDGNLGPEPSEEYMERLGLLDNAVRDCISVSKKYAGLSSPTSRHFYASVLFTVLITRGVSLLNLAPHTPWAEKKIEHWDYASLAVIVRTMIELRIAFYYLCAEECSADEWSVRWNLFNLHDCAARIRMFEALGDVKQVEAFKIQADELRDRLRSNPFFCGLDPKQHRKLLHGQTAYLFPLETIAEKAGISVETFRWIYILFSSHVHGLPMSFYRIGGDNPARGQGLPSPVEESYSTLCLSLAANLIVHARDEIHCLFEGLGRSIGEPVLDESAEDASKKGLAVGESMSIKATDEICLVLTRTAEGEVTTTYLHCPTATPVLERSDSDITGAELKRFDPFFWSFLLNGKPVTEQILARAIESPHAFRVDHVKRKILIKTSAC